MTVLQAALLSMLLGLLAGFGGGWNVAAWRADSEKLDAVARAIRQADSLAAQDREVLVAHETGAERIRTVYRSLKKEVIRYVALHHDDPDCLDADGLRVWTLANAGPDAPAAGQPDYALSAPGTARLGAAGRLAGQPRGDGGAVSRVPGAPPRAVGVGQTTFEGVKP